MPEEELLDMLELISESVRLVQDRLAHIETPEEFCTSPEGTALLDAIAMQLQVFGGIVKTNPITNNEFPDFTPKTLKL